MSKRIELPSLNSTDYFVEFLTFHVIEGCDDTVEKLRETVESVLGHCCAEDPVFCPQCGHETSGDRDGTVCDICKRGVYEYSDEDAEHHAILSEIAKDDRVLLDAIEYGNAAFYSDFAPTVRNDDLRLVVELGLHDIIGRV